MVAVAGTSHERRPFRMTPNTTAPDRSAPRDLPAGAKGARRMPATLTPPRLLLALVPVALAAAAVAAFAPDGRAAQGTDLPQGSERVTLGPADFTTRIDNPYWPLAPGSRW